MVDGSNEIGDSLFFAEQNRCFCVPSLVEMKIFSEDTVDFTNSKTLKQCLKI